MNKKDKKDAKKAYKIAVQINGYNKKMLAHLHRKSENAVEKYLYAKERYPEFCDLLELNHLILVTNGKMPIELRRIINRIQNRARAVAKAYGIYTGYTQNEIVGELLQPRRYEYILNGEIVTRKQLAERFKTTTHAIKYKLEKARAKNGDDISHLNLRP